MNELMIGNVVLVPLLIGILEVFKKLGINEKYIPLISVFFGIVSGFAVNGFTSDKIIENIYTGVAVGLSAVGLYSGAKNTLQK